MALFFIQLQDKQTNAAKINIGLIIVRGYMPRFFYFIVLLRLIHDKLPHNADYVVVALHKKKYCKRSDRLAVVR